MRKWTGFSREERQPPTILQHLPYTRAIFDESLRLYPPAPAVQRKAATNAQSAACHCRQGALVLVSTHNLHRHPDFWTNPDEFLPERWLNGERPAARYAYLPFGAGPRACVGIHFASVEGPLLLALIGRRYDLQLAQENVEAELMVTLRPKGGIRMILNPTEGVCRIERLESFATLLAHLTSLKSEGCPACLSVHEHHNETMESGFLDFIAPSISRTIGKGYPQFI